MRDHLLRLLPLTAALHTVGYWHWLTYHFQTLPPSRFGSELLEACADIEEAAQGGGSRLLTELFGIGGRERYEPHYDQILQKLAEVLIIREITKIAWVQPATYEIESRPARAEKRVDLVVTGENYQYGFEIKAPAYLHYHRQRTENSVQANARGLPREGLHRAVGGVPITLPRDNPIKDFLESADEKFAAFKQENADFRSFLVIVYDDFIQEAISALKHPHSGLLTDESFARNSDGSPKTFPHIDGVILVRHLSYFVSASAERPSPERRGGFDFGTEYDLPNVFFPLTDGLEPPVWLELRALPWDHADLQRTAEYVPSDFVIWI